MRLGFSCRSSLAILGSGNALPAHFREVVRMLEAGEFPVEDAVSAIFPLEDAARMLSK